MKHLLLLFTIAISLMVSGQVVTFPHLQTFDETTIPDGWTQVDHQGNGQIWLFGTTYFGAVLTGNYAYLNSDKYGEGTQQDADLVSPTFDFTDVTSVKLYFNHYFRAYDQSSATLSYSIDNGVTWTVIKKWTTNSSNPEIFNQVIDGVADEPEVKFKWNYIGEYGWGWAIDDVSVSELSEATWTGADDNDWHNADNWSTNAVPGAASKVTIPATLNDPVIQQGAVCSELTVETGAKVTITPGYSLTVFNVFTNNAVNGLVIESDDNGTGSLIAGSTAGTGTAEIQRYMTGNQWHNVSSPVVQTISDFLANNLNIPSNGASRGMTDYNTTDDAWNAFFTNATGGTLEAAKGYLLRNNANGSVTFNGTINTGTQLIELSPLGNGWNLIGNPYTSAICINDDAGTHNFLSYNEISLDPNFFSIYVWNGAEYEIINNASGAEYATLGQGFFVKNTIGTNADFTPAMQVHQPAATLKSKTIKPEIKLLASSSQKSASTEIKFIKGATAGLDKGYDAGILKADPSFSVFTKLVNDNNVEFGLQCLPLPASETMTIPVGIDFSKGGQVTFSAQMLNIPAESKIIFEDRLQNVFTTFSSTKSAYTATLAANTKGTGRFYLHVANAQVTGIGNETLANKINAWMERDEIVINGITENKAVATLYDLRGSSVLVRNLEKATTNRISVNGLNTGIYMLQVLENGKRTGIKLQITGN